MDALDLIARQLDLDSTHRSGRCVTDGRESNQTCQIPDSGEWYDSVGIQIDPLTRDKILIFHENFMKPAEVLDVALQRNMNPTRTNAHENKRKRTSRGYPASPTIG